MSQPFSIDPKGVLIDKLGEDEGFVLSNTYLKNGKGLNAYFEIEKLESELYDFAKDPSLKDKKLGDARPRQPSQKQLAELSEEDAAQEMNDWRELVKQYETVKLALQMQVPPEDMFAIQQYMKPFKRTIHATPAIKGRRFHAFTRDPNEQSSGLFGIGKKSSQAVQ